MFLAFATGLRREELLALRRQDVDLNAAILHVRQNVVRVRYPGAHAKKTALVFQEPKTPQARRTIPLPAQCLTVPRRHRARQAQEKLLLGHAYRDHGLVFCREDGQAPDPRNLCHAHVGTRGIPKTVQTMLGHSRVAITLDIYSHVSLDLRKRAAAKLDAAFEERAKARAGE